MSDDNEDMEVRRICAQEVLEMSQAAPPVAEAIPAQAGASIDTAEFRELLELFLTIGYHTDDEDAQPYIRSLVAHINAAMTAHGQQRREEGLREGAKIASRGWTQIEAELRERAAIAEGMAECMDMVRQELVEAEIIDAGIAPMFVANAVAAWGASLRERAEKAEADLIAQAAENAAFHCLNFNARQAGYDDALHAVLMAPTLTLGGAAVADGVLPPLPDPVRMSSDQSYLGFTADQMLAYARLARAPARATAPLDIDISSVTLSQARREIARLRAELGRIPIQAVTKRSPMAQVSDLACAARDLASVYGMVLTVYQAPRTVGEGSESVVSVRLQ